VARPREVVGNARRVGQQPHRGRPVGRRNARADTLFRVDGDGVGGAVLVLVHGIHRQQAELVADRTVQRHAEVTRGVADHERDEFGSGLLGGEDEVALVLAVLVVDDDHGLASGDVGNRALHRVQPRHHISMNHRSAGLIAPSCSAVRPVNRSTQLAKERCAAR
jgi:hypothetical protein